MSDVDEARDERLRIHATREVLRQVADKAAELLQYPGQADPVAILSTWLEQRVRIQTRMLEQSLTEGRISEAPPPAPGETEARMIIESVRGIGGFAIVEYDGLRAPFQVVGFRKDARWPVLQLAPPSGDIAGPLEAHDTPALEDPE